MSLVDPPSARALTGLEGFLTLANDPTQIRAFYDLHKGLEDMPAMLSFEQTIARRAPGLGPSASENLTIFVFE